MYSHNFSKHSYA